MSDKPGLVPQQHEGRSIDVEERVVMDAVEEAKAFFDIVAARLLNVNKWKDVAGTVSAEFQLVDRSGHELHGAAAEGNLFRIDIPGPGSKTGEGYDWVEVEKIEKDSHTVSMRVRPTSSPVNAESDVAHFYSEKSTSTFTVALDGKTVTVGIYDRNTKPNTCAEKLTDKLRDAIVGAVAVTAFSKIQWRNLAKGLLSQKS